MNLDDRLIFEARLQPLSAEDMKRSLSNIIIAKFITPFQKIPNYFGDFSFDAGETLKEYIKENIWKNVKPEWIVISLRTDFLKVYTYYKDQLNPGNERVSDDTLFLEWLSKEIEKRGWFVMQTNYSGLWFEIILAPNYTGRVDVKSDLYHVAPIEAVERILRKGLLPVEKHSEKRDLPARVYLFLNLETAEHVSANWRMAYAINDYYGMPMETSRGSTDFGILRIKLYNLLPGTKFFNDPEFSKEYPAVWTYTRIPPQAIEVVNKSEWEKFVKDQTEYRKEDQTEYRKEDLPPF